MAQDRIEEIGIDALGVLYVRPGSDDYEFIYRAGLGVYWDRDRKILLAPKLHETTFRDQTLADTFKFVVRAAKEELGIKLIASSAMVWTNVTDDLRCAIEKQMNSD